MIEIESENGIFMYGIDGAGHAPSLYTKYYRAWLYHIDTGEKS